MGPIFIIVISFIAAAIVGRFLARDMQGDSMFRIGGAIIGGFLGAWLIGSATQSSSFMMSAPGGWTLLGGLGGALIGGTAGIVAARRRVE